MIKTSCFFYLIFFSAGTLLAQDSTRLETLQPWESPFEYFLDRAERLGWTENQEARTLYSSSFTATDGKIITYNSREPVNYYPSPGSVLTPVDIRPCYNAGRYEALHQPHPLTATKHASVWLKDNNDSILFSQTTSVNGEVLDEKAVWRSAKNGRMITFQRLVPEVDKQIEFRYEGFKYNYILKTVPQNTQGQYIIKENMVIPAHATVMLASEKEYSNGERIRVINTITGKPMAAIHAFMCYDNNGNWVEGNLTAEQHIDKPNTWTITLSVPTQWLNDPSRSYPVILDPLVTGPTTTWSGGFMPSCFLPAYNVDSILVTVPAGITVTNLDVTASFYADPFTVAIMADGRMYFSTTCNQSQIFQVQPPNGNTAGTAYLANFNLKSPLMCCHPQQCSSYTFYLRMHLGRVANGTTCNTTYIYYNPTTTWPFSAFIEGYTPEFYGAGMSFSPATVCANTCQVNANIFAHYGVPPFTYTHPWSAASATFGNPVGCSTGNYMKQLALDIPGCPDYCDPSTGLSVPPPVVTDACGAVVAGYAPSYNLNITPVSLVTPAQDTTVVCSGQPAALSLNDCLGGSSVLWWGNGLTDTTHTIYDTVTNTGTGPQYIAYIITGNTNGCAFPSDTVWLTVYPNPSQDFSTNPDPPTVTNPVTFTDETSYYGNTPYAWFWDFGDSTYSLLSSPSHTWMEPGEYNVCLFTLTPYPCADTLCRIIQVVPAYLQLPNVISPNGDGMNETLFIKYLDQYSSNRIQVYNRWGLLLFEKENYQNDWKAEGITDGTYYYILTLPGDKTYQQFLHITRLK